MDSQEQHRDHHYRQGHEQYGVCHLERWEEEREERRGRRRVRREKGGERKEVQKEKVQKVVGVQL